MLDAWTSNASQPIALRRYHGLLAQRFALISSAYRECFEECFRRQYALIHRLETNKLRNVAKVGAPCSSLPRCMPDPGVHPLHLKEACSSSPFPYMLGTIGLETDI